jgi:DNA-binding MarR family transcriptional regulator
MTKIDLFIEEFMGKFHKALNLLQGEMKIPWDYGVGFPLYHSEVHLLESIRMHQSANAGDHAGYLGISNAAVSQAVKKLMDKALIEVYQAADNRKEVFFRITELGKKVSDGHLKHHMKIYKPLFRLS